MAEIRADGQRCGQTELRVRVRVTAKYFFLATSGTEKETVRQRAIIKVVNFLGLMFFKREARIRIGLTEKGKSCPMAAYYHIIATFISWAKWAPGKLAGN